MSKIPPITTNLLQACKTCFKDERPGHRLSRCSRCRGVAYCNAGCQKSDWKTHKDLCKGLAALEADTATQKIFLSSLSDKPSSDLEFVNELCHQDMLNTVKMLTMSMKRELRVDEQNIIGWQPRCMGCSRTDRLIRIEGTTGNRSLKPCDTCKTSFYCCEEHWDAVRDKHMSTPVDDNPAGLTQCQLNKHFRETMFLINLMSELHDNSESRDEKSKPYVFEWAPSRHKTAWKPLKDGAGCWEEEFKDEVKKDYGDSDLNPASLLPFLRAASEGLAMPMTVLYGLQKLKSSDDWTRKKTLTIHILGPHEKEFVHAGMFNEILHRLPIVKALRIVLIGPELAGLGLPNPHPCIECTMIERAQSFEAHALTYHEYVKRQGTRYLKPDIAVAFNSGSSENPASWKETMELLVKKKIPSVFTAYNRQEAEAESKLLKAAGATLVSGLGPCMNPWGSLKLIPEPNSVTGFYSTNGWLAGGFC
ncbi:hypothetical protein L218DRAFT_963991 [Marasmius fiardii PR-910]|nr:hypothetical protein L218DRAFT_963991 [Marasmius fiardii PR-910]